MPIICKKEIVSIGDGCFSLPVPSYDLCDKWSVTIGCHVVLPEILKTVVSRIEPAMAS